MTAPPPPCDWQITRRVVNERGQYLLETGIWSDCRFIVGTEPNSVVLEGHKLFLAMSSPVFEAMFFGGMAEKDPIAILDVQPDAFKALLEYIYTDRINLTSFDQACELCYGAKKYMLPHLVEECTKYLWSDLYPKNACRAYEFAKLFEEPILMDKCMSIICNQTQDVLNDASFEEIELSTLLTIVDQEELNINSELELFQALNKYANRHNQTPGVKVPRLDGIAGSPQSSPEVNNNPNALSSIRDAVKKIRFLTLTPQEFAEVPATCDLLTQAEKYAILVNICTPNPEIEMPEGFSKSKISRKMKINLPFVRSQLTSMDTSRTSLISYNSTVSEGSNETPKKLYCIRHVIRVTECMNSSVLDCALTFSCDRNVCVYGIQVPAQVPVEESQQNSFYPELLYAHLLDADGSRLTYTHFTSRVGYRTLIDISFNRPVYIQRHKTYKVGVVLNKAGCYPIGSYPPQSACNGVVFTFSQGHCSDSVRDGLIRSIIFSANSNFIPPILNTGPNITNISNIM